MTPASRRTAAESRSIRLVAAVAGLLLSAGAAAAQTWSKSPFTQAELDMTPAQLMAYARTLDRNRDGYLSSRESVVGIADADLDKDGRMSLGEYVVNGSALRVFAQVRGQLERGFNYEHPTARRVAAQLAPADKNGDGFLTNADKPGIEAQTPPEYDLNRDGRFAMAELVRSIGEVFIAKEASDQHRAALRVSLLGERPPARTAPAPAVAAVAPTPAPVVVATASPAAAPSPEPVPPPVLASAPPPAASAGTGPRIALVIGNSAYDASLGPLANPARDAQTVAAALRRAGFDVEVATDLDQRAMKRAISRLGERLNAAGRSATGLFFYAGHGLQSGGANYLAPIGAEIASEADVDIEGVAADGVLRQMDAVGNATNIVILDACRNTPVLRASRSATRGLARLEGSTGSFIAYSTAPGATAEDGGGANSPFAAALVKEMATPGQPIEVMFRNIRRAVRAGTGDKQTPWDSSSLVESFVFTPAA